ncbi:MAG: tRNA (adenosine(37)-N6)-threonylcarbamoyltransferase complex dimerization subunit type 1 TsaB [Sphingobium sp.]|nr:tRNA (adenosine(37)-N6)-threonylcarbamoyltransferase complex dimerization subunit type 1 TsaB [Sphingobium sp.]
MSARRLVIDCATPALSIALFEQDRLLAAHHSELGRGHAEALLPTIAALPEGGRAGEILVDIGPGSFTGVRVGIAAAVALGFAWHAPVSGFGCLDLVAAMVRDRHKPQAEFPVVMVGGHGELFWARFPADQSDEATAVQSTPIADLAARLGDPVIYGSGAQTLLSARGYGEAVPMLPDARCTALLPSSLRALPPKPNYGRGADAKPMAISGS